MIIIAFTGASVPPGWVLCDGNNGTPNLISRFIQGASSDSDVGTTGGAETHTHTNPNTGSDGAHNHGTKSVTSGTASTQISGTAGTQAMSPPTHTHSISITTGNSAAHTHTVGNTGSATSLPRYVQRKFIMQL